MNFVNRDHLGGYIASDAECPNGDPATYCDKLWSMLMEAFLPGMVLDVGCGEGHAAKFFNTYRPVKNMYKATVAVGIDGMQEAKDKGVLQPNLFYIHDYSKGPWFPPKTLSIGPPPVLVWSCEFVEHVEAQYAENFLQTFDMADVVCMTHAFPKQGGHHHVNCQDANYWLRLMEKRNFLFDPTFTKMAREVQSGTHFSRSGLIFRKKHDGQ